MNLWDNIKCTNMHIIRVAKEDERENGTEQK